MAVLPPVDLYAIGKAQAWRSLWIGMGTALGGLVVTVLGLVTGFLIILGVILIIAGLVRFFGALSSAADPTRKLIHLGMDQVVRRQAFRAAEAELSQPSTYTFRTIKGTGMVSASWVVYHDANDLLVCRREDVIWVYPVQKKRQRNIVVQVRSGLRMEIDDVGLSEEQLMQSLSFAAPAAFYGYDARVAMTPLPALVYEVDRRRGAVMGPGPAANPYGGYGGY